MGWLHQELAESNKWQETAYAQLATQLDHLIDHLQLCDATSPPQDGPATPSTSQSPSDIRFSSTSPENTHLRLSSPEQFSGESGNCGTFLTQCELHFKFQAAFPSDHSKIAYMISYLLLPSQSLGHVTRGCG